MISIRRKKMEAETHTSRREGIAIRTGFGKIERHDLIRRGERRGTNRIACVAFSDGVAACAGDGCVRYRGESQE